MERKAWENLEAARLLLQGEDPCPNAAASRAYYAAYQACWAAMVRKKGIEPPEVRPGSTYFRHPDLPHEAREAGVLNERESKVLADLCDLRVAADYYEDVDVTVEEVREALQRADPLVRRLLEDEADFLLRSVLDEEAE
jgi:uncharacterized protein (UPF0332 family)